MIKNCAEFAQFFLFDYLCRKNTMKRNKLKVIARYLRKELTLKKLSKAAATVR